MKRIKLVCVEWVDAEADAGWSRDDPKDDKPMVLKTFGLLVRKTKDWVIHADTYLPDTKMWGSKGKIPTGMVRKIRVITTVEYP